MRDEKHSPSARGSPAVKRIADCRVWATVAVGDLWDNMSCWQGYNVVGNGKDLLDMDFDCVNTDWDIDVKNPVVRNHT